MVVTTIQIPVHKTETKTTEKVLESPAGERGESTYEGGTDARRLA